MKTEEIRRYEEEFRAMREMLSTYYLELGIPAPEKDVRNEDGEKDMLPSSESVDRPDGDSGGRGPAPDGGGG